MHLPVYCGTTATHRQASYCSIFLFSDDPVGGFDQWHELGEEERVIGPSGHIEIAVPEAFIDIPPRIGCHDDHLHRLTGGDELIHHILHMPPFIPTTVGIVHPVKEV